MKQFVTILMMLASLAICAQERVNVGDILCTDNTVVSPENYASSGRTALGIVFFVDNSQQHGWALALNDAVSGTMIWGDNENLCYLGSYNNNPQNALLDTAGAARCDSIVRKAQSIGMPLSTYSNVVAAALQNGDGWYLPSIGQLSILYANIPEINSAINAIAGSATMNGTKYWSCTEENYGVVSAWLLNYDGTVFASPKGTTASVRAIRNF